MAKRPSSTLTEFEISEIIRFALIYPLEIAMTPWRKKINAMTKDQRSLLLARIFDAMPGGKVRGFTKTPELN